VPTVIPAARPVPPEPTTPPPSHDPSDAATSAGAIVA
jgi:hypothetical protein